MSEERLVNLNMKDCILEKWKGKLGYPLNQKDIEELEHIIDYYEQENQQLKEQLEVSKQYEDYYKDLCDKALKTGGKYISVIKEIREYIVDDIQHCTYGQVPKYQDILQILDKVKE